jgi:hypothetical protein
MTYPSEGRLSPAQLPIPFSGSTGSIPISHLPDPMHKGEGYTKPEKTEPVQLAKCLEVELDEDETTQTLK